MRRLRWGGAAALGVACLAVAGGLLDASTATQLRRTLLVPVIPLVALLLADAPIRRPLGDGTLLHHLLGPVERPSLLVARTGALLVALAPWCALAAAALAVAAGAGPEATIRDALAASLAVVAYVGLGGLANVWTKRGFLVGLGGLLLVDLPIGALPFSLRQLAPSAHVAMTSGWARTDDWAQPLAALGDPLTHPALSALALLAIGLSAIALSARRFRRMPLSTLC